MSILAETAATSADEANGRKLRHGGIEIRVQFAQFSVKRRNLLRLTGTSIDGVGDHF
jgi:hypothetical protein